MLKASGITKHLSKDYSYFFKKSIKKNLQKFSLLGSELSSINRMTKWKEWLLCSVYFHVGTSRLVKIH